MLAYPNISRKILLRKSENLSRNFTKGVVCTCLGRLAKRGLVLEVELLRVLLEVLANLFQLLLGE